MEEIEHTVLPVCCKPLLLRKNILFAVCLKVSRDYHIPNQRMSKKLGQTFAICCQNCPIDGSAELDVALLVLLAFDWELDCTVHNRNGAGTERHESRKLLNRNCEVKVLHYLH